MSNLEDARGRKPIVRDGQDFPLASNIKIQTPPRSHLSSGISPLSQTCPDVSLGRQISGP
jgi:hypothetical protein